MASKPLPWLQPAVLLGGLLPLALLLYLGAHGGLGANPVERALNQLGLLSLVLLVASLACTPLRLVFKWTWPARLRKLLGLLGFAYAVLHFLTYVVVDQGLDFAVLLQDVAKRPFITVGFTALLLLVPLAATSTAASVRRLGFHHWTRLHRLAYVAGALGVVHFYWRVKKDVSEPLAYAAVLGVLFAVRIVEALRKRLARKASPAAPARS